MDGNIRKTIFVAVDTEKEPGEMTLREVVEWFKKVMVAGGTEANFAELKYMNERWAEIVSQVAKREGVPVGFLSYMLNELATSEVQLVETAVVEAEAVT